jgi:hypothetical protein
MLLGILSKETVIPENILLGVKYLKVRKAGTRT